MNPNDEATLQCRLKDLEADLRWILRFWEIDLEELESYAGQAETETSRKIIADSRQKWRISDRS